MVLEGEKKTRRNVPLLRRHVVYDCAHRQAGLSRPSQRDKPFPGNLNLPLNNRKRTIYHRHVRLHEQGVLGQQELLVKSYNRGSNALDLFALFVFDDIRIISHLCYHVIKLAEHPVSASLSSSHVVKVGPCYSHL